MEILLNDKNEIVSFALIGGFEDGIKVSGYPEGFILYFKPRLYKYENEKISLNEDYTVSDDAEQSTQPPNINTPGNDKELRRMFSSMQVQIVQGNKMVNQLTQQNANLLQQIVQLSQEVEKLKGGNSDETTVSEV